MFKIVELVIEPNSPVSSTVRSHCDCTMGAEGGSRTFGGVRSDLALTFISLLKIFVGLFLVVLGLHGYVQIFSSYGEQGVLSSCGAQASHCGGFSLHSMGSRACGLQWLQLTGLVALWHVGSSQTRD